MGKETGTGRGQELFQSHTPLAATLGFTSRQAELHAQMQGILPLIKFPAQNYFKD